MGRTTPAVAAALFLLLPCMAAAQNVNMGETFHGLEARARRVTLTFPDAVVEVHRTADKAMEGVIRTRAGAVGGRLRVADGDRRVHWQHEGSRSASQEFPLPDGAAVGLDWAGHQLYALHSDAQSGAAAGVTADVAGEAGMWEGHLRRNRRAAGRGVSSGQLASRLEAIETVFDEVVVRAALDRHDRRKSPKTTHYSRFTAQIVDARTGARRGFVRWFDTAQVLTWKIEGGDEGVVMPDRLPGGWTFTPTMAWANVQGYQFATQAARTLKASDPFAAAMRGLFQRPSAAPPFAQLARAIAPLPTTAWDLLSSRVAPVLPDVPELPGGWRPPFSFGGVRRVNEEGCDRLHWLDGTVFRMCCDIHDRCYEKNGCSEKSWFWPFAGSWSCQRCNVQAVYCFCTASNPMYCGSGGGTGSSSGGEGCSSVAGGFCPIECQTCQAN